MSKQVILISTLNSGDGVAKFSRIPPPMGLLSLATLLMDFGLDVLVVNPYLEDHNELLWKQVRSGNVLFVGMTVFMGVNLSRAIELTCRIKEEQPDVPVVWGGPLPSQIPKECFDYAPLDWVVRGPGEDKIICLARKIMGEDGATDGVSRIYHRSDSELLSHLDSVDTWKIDNTSIGRPALALWREGVLASGAVPILSSRGCPRNCAFCYNNTVIGRKKWFSLSADEMIEDIEYWCREFGLSRIYFVDDNFLVDTERAVRILTQVKARNIEVTQVLGHLNDFKKPILDILDASTSQVGFAIESASAKIQELINKPLDLNRIIELCHIFTEKGIQKINTNFMFGFPGENIHDIQESINLALTLRSINPKIRMVPCIYCPQPLDDIIAKVGLNDTVHFDLDYLTATDYTPNRSETIDPRVRPWMTEEDIVFYKALVLAWFYHFDYVVRSDQGLNIEKILSRSDRLRDLFASIPEPEN